MVDPDKSSSSPSLPPGCRFYPSEEEIFRYYLRLKNSATSSEESNACGVIKEINLCNFAPSDLPDAACFRFGYRGRKRHWYCYRERINVGGEGRARRTGFGWWKRRGTVRDVMGEVGGRKVVLGKRTCFAFYSINGGSNSDNGRKRGVRTDCVMYEYALNDNTKASFVLCRIFFKSRDHNHVSEHALSCCAEGIGATVRHIGIQHNGSITSNIDENDSHQRLDNKKKGLADERFGVPSDVQLNSLVRSSEHADDSAILENVLDAQHSTYVLEGDFIELDDLL